MKTNYKNAYEVIKEMTKNFKEVEHWGYKYTEMTEKEFDEIKAEVLANATKDFGKQFDRYSYVSKRSNGEKRAQLRTYHHTYVDIIIKD